MKGSQARENRALAEASNLLGCKENNKNPVESWLTPHVGGSPVGLVHLWTDQRIPGPVSCHCRGGSLETPPRWHATIGY